ncbi:MAG: zinc ribbon domain-containing protein [Micrococcales bacterium]|nr:zinc ribbon domain-containing protein [Micrococcales bacterium]MCL2667781.1 zinc ribbon domain-containing protein [Micrococcales bacterium]
MQAFTNNFHDKSADAGFQFVFDCDSCRDGYTSSFIASKTYKKGRLMRTVGGAARGVGYMATGHAGHAGYAAGSMIDRMDDRYHGKSPEWRKEHEKSFERAQNEAMKHFHRCPGCNSWVCDQCLNEDAGLCVKCAPRANVMVAKEHASATGRNIKEAAKDAQVWHGSIEQKTTMCPMCGKPAGSGNFCNNCGGSMQLKQCPSCHEPQSLAVSFCSNCGTSLAAAAPPAPPAPAVCGGCGVQNPPGTRFCGQCGTPA